MNDQRPEQHMDDPAGVDPALERELRALSAWDASTPSPSLASRALAEHDQEMREIRGRRSWSRQGGLMAAAVAIAGLGLSVGMVTANRPVERMRWTPAPSSVTLRAEFDQVDAQPSSERFSRGIGGAAPDIAGGAQGGATQSQQESQVIGQAREQAPPGSSGQAEPAAPAAAAPPSPPASRTGSRGTAAGTAVRDASKKEQPAPTTGDVAKPAEPSSGRAEPAPDPAGIVDKAAAGNSNNLSNLNNESDGNLNDRSFGRANEDIAPRGLGAAGGVGGLRGELVQPTARDWVAFIARSALIGSPWILLGLALIAIAWIRMRR